MTLECKSGAFLNREILSETYLPKLSKAVSGYANSVGGALILGVVEEDHTPVRVDDGLDPLAVLPAWLEQVIDANLQRRVPDLRIRQAHLAGSNRVSYVVYAPQGVIAPYMASTKGHYKRHNYRSVPMEEYEVLDLANRTTVPDLAV